jgi:hypothetical protein
MTEHFPGAKRPVSRQENGLVSDAVANSGNSPNSPRRMILRRFRPLFAPTQSTAPEKLANPMTTQ